MTKVSYAVTARSSAPPQAVFDVFADAPGWKQWLPFREAGFEREGAPPPGGVGAIRRLGPGFGKPSREEIVEYDPPYRAAYVFLSGPIPLKNYRADLVLSESGGGTDISWSGTGESWLPGMGAMLGLMVGRFAKRMAREAERRHGAG